RRGAHGGEHLYRQRTELHGQSDSRGERRENAVVLRLSCVQSRNPVAAVRAGLAGLLQVSVDLTPLAQQRLAIEAPLGPILVVAGPGAGKTYCLIARINHLINTRGLAPERICAVTFTNRAAEEIAVRLKHTLGDRAEGVTRGTIHAL